MLNAPFHCFEQIIIFSKWKGRSLTRNRRSLLPTAGHFSDHNDDLLVLKQWKGALNRIMSSLGAQALSYLVYTKTVDSVFRAL